MALSEYVQGQCKKAKDRKLSKHIQTGGHQWASDHYLVAIWPKSGPSGDTTNKPTFR